MLQVLLEKPFRERKGLLHLQFPPFKPSTKGAAQFDHVKSCESTEGEATVQLFWRRAVASRCEGLMIKVSRFIVLPGTASYKPPSFWTVEKLMRMAMKRRINLGGSPCRRRTSQIRGLRPG
jgi:ATP-dependent DNA ligase